jgi:penicillin-binding protein 1A
MEAIRRENISLEMVPQHVRDAFLVTEDRRFYGHSGLDWRAVLRALSRNVRSLGVREGFSTITMQLARNSFIAGAGGRSAFGRKLLELRVARLLEGNLTKQEIFTLYLNAIYMGGGVYGVEGASRDLFGKSVTDIGVAQAALLAALPKAPSVYNPRSDSSKARTRRNVVLSLMLESGSIDSAAYRTARSTPIKVASGIWSSFAAEPGAISAVRTSVDSLLHALQREGEEVVVYTTLDVTAQRAAEAAVSRRAALIQRESDAWYGKSRGQIQGAMVAIDPANGAILALVGASQYERGGFNRATNAYRQPGSAFKPFVFAAAMARGLTPATLVDDIPVEIRDAGKMWTPANYGGEYFGRITLRAALMKSANAATVRVSRAVGEANVVQVARGNGIVSDLQPVPAIALGALEVTPLELVSSYAPFANGGLRVQPHLVRRIESREGEFIWEAQTETVQVMDQRDAFLVTSMLRSVVDEGTGTAIRAHGVQGVVAGKTGTSNDAADLWFVGYTPTLVAGFWFGFDIPLKISGGANGGRHAAPAWAEFYRNGWRSRDIWRGWRAPAGLVTRLIDEETGHLAGDGCPDVRDEWFKVGSEPTAYCDAHAASFGRWISRLGRDLGRALGNITRRGRVDTLRTNRQGTSRQSTNRGRSGGRGGGGR